jgi:hypothetical protein
MSPITFEASTQRSSPDNGRATALDEGPLRFRDALS